MRATIAIHPAVSEQPASRMRPGHILDFVTARTTAFGERHGIDWLTYNPLQMLAYHQLARRDAPAVAASITGAFPDCQSLADVGCGSGAFAAELRGRSRSVAACEHAAGGRLAARLQGVPVTKLDLDRESPAQLPNRIDLAYCFEVAEHCTPSQGDRLVAFLCRLAPTVVFSAAHPGQGGLGHINEQDQQYWGMRFEANGSPLSSEATEDLRRRFLANDVTAPWFVDNVMVFRRAGVPS
jgi:SAM-dependent methyltransferase